MWLILKRRPTEQKEGDDNNSEEDAETKQGEESAKSPEEGDGSNSEEEAKTKQGKESAKSPAQVEDEAFGRLLIIFNIILLLLVFPLYPQVLIIILGLGGLFWLLYRGNWSREYFWVKDFGSPFVRMLQPFLMVTRHFWKGFKDYLRYSNRVFIKINLSQDDIKEIDILRLIAKNVYLKYREFNNSWRTDLHWKVVRVFMLLLIVGLVYNFETVRQINHSLKHEFHVACYFPSQGHFYLKDEAEAYLKALEGVSDRSNADGLSLRQRLSEAPLSLEGLALSDEQMKIQGRWAPRYSTHPPFEHAVSDGFSGRVQHLGMEVTGALDLFIQDLYHRVYRSVPESLKAWTLHSAHAKGSGGRWVTVQGLVDRPIELFPKFVDYLFLFYLVGTWLALGFVLRWPSVGLVSHRMILKRLEELNEMIESRVTRETGILPAPTGALFSVNFGRRESRTSPNLTERDIEKYLLEILSLIDRIPRLTVHPEFVIIFDELDKIQHHENYTLVDKEEQQNEFQGREFASIEAERERQHRILSLVSNLKHFLTTAPAKFVFIAGREMFDASLADISDRHFFMGSVFNEVLHVPSLHSDDSDCRLPDITSLTEQYLCRFLLPRRWWRHGLTLETFREYLEEELWPDRVYEDPDHGESEEEPFELAKREREKLLYELHNFITYLTYRSNGAPKKITRTIERYLVRFDPEILQDSDNLCFGRSSRSLYLRFNYYDQYTFGLITYIGGPLIFSLNRAIKDYGDKILVSSSFLLDHIYKFHGEGFSWRNLELLPEIVDINRAPQLRELIIKIMRFLAKSDITEIVSGLYDFKFNRRITEEIAFLSKISEEESAAFNFTLDESLAIKRHFNRKLYKLLQTYKDYPNAGEEKFVNSIAFVRMILGDMHFYDGELDSAIIEYMEAVQALRNLDTENIRIDTLVLMVRNFLKLGLAFERKKSYESAFVTYGRICAMLTQIGERSREDTRSWHRRVLGKDLHKAERIFNQTAFEGIRLIYQPMFARLQLIEKSTLGGITERDIGNVVEEFNRMLSPVQAKERFLIDGEFKNKLGDILYFKNGPLPRRAADVYCHSSKSLCGKNKSWATLTEKARYRLPCMACTYYHEALSGLCENYLELSIKDLKRKPWVHILRAFEVGRGTADRQNSLKELAVTLSDLGNTFLSCSLDKTIDQSYIQSLLELLESADNSKRSESLERALEKLGRGPNKIEEALTCFVLASLLFRWGANNQACARELSKIMWTLREWFAVNRTEDNQLVKVSSKLHKALKSILIKQVIRQSYLCHEGTHRLEIEKLKEIFETDDKPRPFIESVNLGRLSISASIIETLAVYDEIGLFVDGAPLEPVPLDRRCSPHAMFHSVFARIHALRYRARVHYQNLKALGILKDSSDGAGSSSGSSSRNSRIESLPDPSKIEVILGGSLTTLDAVDPSTSLLEFMLTDAIYCHHEIIRFLGIYGTSYMASYSMRAAAHRNLAFWCDLYYNYLRDYETLNPGKQERIEAVRRLEKELQRMVGKADMVDLSPNYHAEMALRCLEAAKEAHSEGKAYSALIDKMYYLTDDFADQLEHFCAGLERLRINSGAFDRELQRLRKRLDDTSIYKSDRYTGSGWIAGNQKRYEK